MRRRAQVHEMFRGEGVVMRRRRVPAAKAGVYERGGCAGRQVAVEARATVWRQCHARQRR